MPRSLTIAVACLAVLVTASVAALPAVGAGTTVDADRTTRAIPEQDLPCGPTADRTIDPLIVEEGLPIDIAVQFDYACPEGKREVAFYLVIENSSAMDPPRRFGESLLDNVRDGLGLFVEQMDFDNGSQGGMVLYTSGSNEHTALATGASGRQALLSAVRTFPAAGSSARGAAGAVEMAAQNLAAADAGPDAYRYILLVDAGATLDDVDEVVTACSAAADAGVHVAVFALAAAGDRLSDCAEPNLYREASRMQGQDVAEKLEPMGDGIARGKQADSVLYADTLSLDVTYVDGSADPEPSSEVFGELVWEFAPPAPEGGQTITYQVLPDSGVSSVYVSDEAKVSLAYADGTLGEVDLENPEVCVYRVGRPDDCADYALTLTPPVPTDTPTDVPTPTEEPPTPTETPSTSEVWILLPVALDHDRL